MPALRRRSIWTRKAPASIGVNWSNPLALGLAGAWAMQDGCGTVIPNLATNGASNNGTLTNGPTWASSSIAGAEWGLSFTAASSQYVDCGALAAISGAAQATIFMLGNCPSGSTSWQAGRTHSGQNNAFELIRFTDGKTYMVYGAGTGNPSADFTTTATGDHSICGVFDGPRAITANGAAIYLDGISQSLTMNGTAPATLQSASDSWVLQHDSVNAVYGSGRLDLVLLWIGRALLAAEVASLSASPWQLFQPAAGEWLTRGFSAAAGVVPYWHLFNTNPLSGVA